MFIIVAKVMPSDWLQIKLQVFNLVVENMNFLFAYSAFV